MSEHKRTIVHEHKLELSTKLILAAIAIALALQILGPMERVGEILAEIGNLRMECSGPHPSLEALSHGGWIELKCSGSLQ